MNFTKASYCSDSFCCRMLSYSVLTCSTLSSHILSAIMVICFRVKIGFSTLPLLVPACSMSIMGSGELGADTGEGGPWDTGEPGDCGPVNWRRFLSLLISSLRLLAICSGVRGVSLKTEGVAEGVCFSGVQCGL